VTTFKFRETPELIKMGNPPKATKIFLGESGENLNYVHTYFLKKVKPTDI
jgi:hypothetical protein